MKKLFIAFALVTALFSCKKETSSSETNSNEVKVSSINCESATITGEIIKGQPVSNVTATIDYTGGNGKTYLTKSYTSSGVTGLSATLLAGTLANGEGTLVYTISGTPTSSGTANFSIDLGEKSCTIKIAVSIAPISGYGPNIIDVENNTYKTVYIGTQQWMGENLKVSKYSDGTTIPNITDNTQWASNTKGAWCYYDNNAANNAKYGKLYNWYAVSKTTNGNKNVCPTGWHVPTYAEWRVLTDYLGGSSVAGGKLKEAGTTSWNSPNFEASNTSLFTGLPGGGRYYDGLYKFIGDFGYWWSSTELNTGTAWYRPLSYYGGDANGDNDDTRSGFSVRCLRD